MYSLARVSSLTVVVLVSLLATPLLQAAIYDANVDFVNLNPDPNPNPNGVWTYGYSDTLGSAFIPFTSAQFVSDSNGFGWNGGLGLGTPAYFKITASSPVNGVLPGETALHGGPGGQNAILRFTAPSTGIYSISAWWKPGDSSDADLFLLLNSNAVLPLASTPSTNVAGSFQVNSLSLSAGDQIDLSLGTLGSFFNDSTPVNMVISTGEVPEPASIIVWSLLALIGGCAAYRRRKAA